jgi:hypothetical protein
VIKRMALAPDRSGVYRSPSQVQTVRDSVLASGGCWFDINLGPVRTKEQLLETIAAACDFPPTFGRNWDALADALQDFSWCPSDAYGLHLLHGGAAARVLHGDWPTLLEILVQSAMHWKERGKLFIAFVDDAPELPPWT